MKHGGQTRHKYPVAEHCRSREQAQTRCGVATSSISNNLLSRDYRVLSKPGQERNYRNYERETSVVHMRQPSTFHQLSFAIVHFMWLLQSWKMIFVLHWQETYDFHINFPSVDLLISVHSNIKIKVKNFNIKKLHSHITQFILLNVSRYIRNTCIKHN